MKDYIVHNMMDKWFCAFGIHAGEEGSTLLCQCWQVCFLQLIRLDWHVKVKNTLEIHTALSQLNNLYGQKIEFLHCRRAASLGRRKLWPPGIHTSPVASIEASSNSSVTTARTMASVNSTNSRGRRNVTTQSPEIFAPYSRSPSPPSEIRHYLRTTGIIC